jgi:hypothetical protein
MGSRRTFQNGDPVQVLISAQELGKVAEPQQIDARPADLALSAIFLLRQDHLVGRPRLALLPQALAFSALLAHAHCYDVHDRSHTRRLVDSYLAIVALVPVLSLHYRPGLQRLAQLVQIIQDAAGTCSPRSTFRLPGVVR